MRPYLPFSERSVQANDGWSGCFPEYLQITLVFLTPGWLRVQVVLKVQPQTGMTVLLVVLSGLVSKG